MPAKRAYVEGSIHAQMYACLSICCIGLVFKRESMPAMQGFSYVEGSIHV